MAVYRSRSEDDLTPITVTDLVQLNCDMTKVWLLGLALSLCKGRRFHKISLRLVAIMSGSILVSMHVSLTHRHPLVDCSASSATLPVATIAQTTKDGQPMQWVYNIELLG